MVLIVMWGDNFRKQFKAPTPMRTKGQITVPQETRNLLGVEEGDDLLFYTDEAGRVVVPRAQIIDPEQAWF